MDYDLKTAGGVEAEPEIQTPPLEHQLSPEELRELATIADEMRHLRRQWISQAGRPAAGQFVGYSNTRR